MTKYKDIWRSNRAIDIRVLTMMETQVSTSLVMLLQCFIITDTQNPCSKSLNNLHIAVGEDLILIIKSCRNLIKKAAVV